VKKAEKFRRQIIGEISKKVAQIQNGMYSKCHQHILLFRKLTATFFVGICDFFV